jgi:hypothetical protein
MKPTRSLPNATPSTSTSRKATRSGRLSLASTTYGRRRPSPDLSTTGSRPWVRASHDAVMIQPDEGVIRTGDGRKLRVLDLVPEAGDSLYAGLLMVDPVR